MVGEAQGEGAMPAMMHMMQEMMSWLDDSSDGMDGMDGTDGMYGMDGEEVIDGMDGICGVADEGGNVTEVLEFTAPSMLRIVGPGGKSINEVRISTGATVWMKRKGAACVVTIEGTRSQVEAAKDKLFCMPGAELLPDEMPLPGFQPWQNQQQKSWEAEQQECKKEDQGQKKDARIVGPTRLYPMSSKRPAEPTRAPSAEARPLSPYLTSEPSSQGYYDPSSWNAHDDRRVAPRVTPSTATPRPSKSWNVIGQSTDIEIEKKNVAVRTPPYDSPPPSTTPPRPSKSWNVIGQSTDIEIEKKNVAVRAPPSDSPPRVRPPSNKPTGCDKTYACKLHVGIENDRQFRVASRVIALSREIWYDHFRENGGKTRFWGRGLGGEHESDEPLTLFISCCDKGAFDRARLIAEEKLSTLRADYTQFREAHGQPIKFTPDPSPETGRDKDDFDKGTPGPRAPSEEDIELLIEARNMARKEGDYAKADEIRDQLKENGVVLMDEKNVRGQLKGSEVTRWRYWKEEPRPAKVARVEKRGETHAADWEYLDNKDVRCGPFSNWQMRQWWERHMFPRDLRIRPYDAAVTASEQEGTENKAAYRCVEAVFKYAPAPFAAGWEPRAGMHLEQR